ncbi:MAG: type II toxin-antitoxin system VapC family toxin [Candidatus Latescibacteria bacterium]|nr:VapC toxin family PIN domain ribonuclease [Gemmatimonadaceae bacterium]MDP6015483.1 type II toxin-antitoxin system VapC family toxin [Candidatus Latescibacterota bacterium]
MPFVLDSVALLAHLGDEAGAARVREVLTSCRSGLEVGYMTEINIGETLYITERERGTAEAARVLGLIDQLPLTQVPATRPQILAAAHIKAQAPISYADAFVVAAAREFSATILTGDHEFESVEAGVEVEWLPG